jgi:predicted SprT family Zn-dependent metalloprotease
MIKDLFPGRKNETIIGRTYADWKYRTAHIYINLPALKRKTSYQIEEIIVHELMHVLVNEMREGNIKHEERVVTSLTESIFWTVADTEEKKP